MNNDKVVCGTHLNGIMRTVIIVLSGTVSNTRLAIAIAIITISRDNYIVRI